MLQHHYHVHHATETKLMFFFRYSRVCKSSAASLSAEQITLQCHLPWGTTVWNLGKLQQSQVSKFHSWSYEKSLLLEELSRYIPQSLNLGNMTFSTLYDKKSNANQNSNYICLSAAHWHTENPTISQYHSVINISFILFKVGVLILEFTFLPGKW